MNNINFLDFEPFLFLGKKFDDDCFIWIRNNFINKNYKDKENNKLNYYSSLNDGISFCFKIHYLR